MLKEILSSISNFKEKKDLVLVDCTVGLGGHAKAILESMPPNSVDRFLGCDRDRNALDLATPLLRDTITQQQPQAKMVLEHSTFDNFLASIPEGIADAILLDLGASSMQFDDPERGFSFRRDGPLDIRMDNSNEGLTAFQIVNEYPEFKLASIFNTYGEEPNFRAVARKIAMARRLKKIETTKELVSIIEDTCGQKRVSHSTTRVFQALRIEVNKELELLGKAIPLAMKALKQEGKLLVLTFHPIEDRIVLSSLEKLNKTNSNETQDLDSAKKKRRKPKAYSPTFEEISKNPRARSAHLRVIIKS